ncbi:MAG TPA: hypothetical protein VK163_05800 [Opitutaceae bacterium]|nr:hypothetical protein [Opitutaceae bacterium]
MHPQRELDQLAARKAELLRELDHQRAACGASATRLVCPWVWADDVGVVWRQFAPARRTPVAPRADGTRPTASGSWQGWASLTIGAARLVLRMVEGQPTKKSRGPDGVGAED